MFLLNHPSTQQESYSLASFYGELLDIISYFSTALGGGKPTLPPRSDAKSLTLLRERCDKLLRDGPSLEPSKVIDENRNSNSASTVWALPTIQHFPIRLKLDDQVLSQLLRKLSGTGASVTVATAYLNPTDQLMNDITAFKGKLKGGL